MYSIFIALRLAGREVTTPRMRTLPLLSDGLAEHADAAEPGDLRQRGGWSPSKRGSSSPMTAWPSCGGSAARMA